MRNVKPRHALAALIDEAKRVNGWSDQDIVDRAAASGHQLSKTNISRIRNSDVVMLSLNFVTELAAGTGLPMSTIARAALASMGIVVGSDEWTVEQAIQRDAGLSARDKRTLLAMVATMREEVDDVQQANTEKTDPAGQVPRKTVKANGAAQVGARTPMQTLFDETHGLAARRRLDVDKPRDK